MEAINGTRKDMRRWSSERQDIAQPPTVTGQGKRKMAWRLAGRHGCKLVTTGQC